MIKDFFAPIMDFVFDKFGMFALIIGPAIALLIPIMCVVVLLLIVRIIKRAILAKRMSLRARALECEKNGDLAGALQFWQRYLKKMPGTPDDFYLFALLCQKGAASDWGHAGENVDPALWLKKASDAGHLPALFELGKYLRTNSTESLEQARGVGIIREAAEKGCSEAVAYMSKIKKERDAILGLHTQWHIRTRAELGDANAQFELAATLIEKSKENAQTALAWLELSAQQGFVEAWYGIGLIHYQGHGVPRDKKKGLQMLQKAAEAGSVQAQLRLGYAYREEEDPIDLDKAIEWYEKAAQTENAQAQSALAQIYQEKALQRRNEEDALLGPYDPKYRAFIEKRNEWLRKAAKNGSKSAADFLRRQEERRKNSGVRIF